MIANAICVDKFNKTISLWPYCVSSRMKPTVFTANANTYDAITHSNPMNYTFVMNLQSRKRVIKNVYSASISTTNIF